MYSNRSKKEGETGTSSVSASLLLFQTRCRFDYAVLITRSLRQVLAPLKYYANRQIHIDDVRIKFV